MHEDPSRTVNFVWAGSDGQSRGSYAMSHNPDRDSSTFIPGNITSLFFNVPGYSIDPSNETATGWLLGADATKFWFEVTEHGNKTVFDQNGVGFPLGETTILPAEGSCWLTRVIDSSNVHALFVQIGVSRPVSVTISPQVTHLSPYHNSQVVKGANPSSVNVELFGFTANSQAVVVPAVFNQNASASNTQIDVWSVNITDRNTLSSASTCVSQFRLGGVSEADTNGRAGSKSRLTSTVVLCRNPTPT
jgi:hypothetical protein